MNWFTFATGKYNSITMSVTQHSFTSYDWQQVIIAGVHHVQNSILIWVSEASEIIPMIAIQQQWLPVASFYILSGITTILKGHYVYLNIQISTESNWWL